MNQWVDIPENKNLEDEVQGGSHGHQGTKNYYY